MASKRKKKPSGLRNYWPDKTLKECEALREEMYKLQDYRCAICKKHKDDEGRHLAVDHSHKTGRVRGLLCYRCNKFKVGRQTIESCQEVLDYLKKYDLPLEIK